MKKLIVFLLSFNSIQSNAQSNWFKLYTDSALLVKEANAVATEFVADISKLAPAISLKPAVILNTTPWLIYYSPDEKVNLPLWSQIIPSLKEFTANISGGKENGEQLFALFFNGFYLPHELGHAFQHKIGKAGSSGSYDNEYFANTVAMLWWKKQNRQKELEQCYELSKKIIRIIPNPLPQGADIKKYYTDNYESILADKENFPYLYGFMQFTQFILIYEDKTLPLFDEFIRNYLAR